MRAGGSGDGSRMCSSGSDDGSRRKLAMGYEATRRAAAWHGGHARARYHILEGRGVLVGTCAGPAYARRTRAQPHSVSIDGGRLAYETQRGCAAHVRSSSIVSCVLAARVQDEKRELVLGRSCAMHLVPTPTSHIYVVESGYAALAAGRARGLPEPVAGRTIENASKHKRKLRLSTKLQKQVLY